jgi:protein ImuB
LKRMATDRIARQQAPEPRPLAVTGKRGNIDAVVALNAAAERKGLRRQLSLTQARAMCPGLVVVEEDPAADARLLEDIADWCQRYTPLVACDAPDGILLDIAGCAHLFGGEAALIGDIADRFHNFGFSIHIGVAGTIGAAWAMARYAESPCAMPGCEREWLLPLPLSALRIEEDTAAALHRLGFKRIGDIVDLTRAPLAARFGGGLLRQLDRALGREHEPLMPRLPVAPYIVEQPFAEPIAREEDILEVTERLARRLSLMLERRGEGLRYIELTLFRTDGKVSRIVAGTSRPIRNAGDVRTLFVERLAALADPLDPGFGFDLARLSVMVAEPCPPQQTTLDSDVDDADLDRLIDRLSARLGARRVTKLVAQDSHIPELAGINVPAQSLRADTDRGGAEFRRFRATAELSPRPLRLLVKPEPIETIASVPDGPPLRFRWRRVLHEVIAAEGPERIEGAWWSEDGGKSKNLARDYFRVEDKSGRRFWIYRAGLYRDTVAGAPPPAWFLHGMFG